MGSLSRLWAAPAWDTLARLPPPAARPPPADLDRYDFHVAGDYPVGLLAREAAPPYPGEGPHALWHFSEDPALGLFRPHVPATNPGAEPLVWAVDTRHAPMFWFPRQCPRGCVWPVSTTTPEDYERFFGQSTARRVHVVESGWLGAIRCCRLYAYLMPTEAFGPHGVGGFWVARDEVEAVERAELGDLLDKHAAAEIELRATPSIWPFWDRAATSSLGFSGHRLANAPRPGAPAPVAI